MTPLERDVLLAELDAHGAQGVTGAQAILDEVELGARVAESFTHGTAD